MGTRNFDRRSKFSYQIGENIVFDLDHILNGKGSREHHQDVIRQAQRAKFAREVKAKQTNNKVISPLRAVLVALIHLIAR